VEREEGAGESEDLMGGKNSTRLCSVEDCDRLHLSRGYCAAHYSRWYRNGDARLVKTRPMLSQSPRKRQETPDRNMRYYVKKRYGITLDEYRGTMARLREEQENVCPLCGLPDPDVLDHDHETGEFRGVLHRKCNSGLGQLGDSVATLERAIDYLKARAKAH
jgi:hypothetical protein